MSARVLVTGAGGFIGSHLCRDLALGGSAVLALDLELGAVRALEAPGHLTLLEGDVTEAAVQARAVDGVDVVYHLAAAHLGAGIRERHFRRVNVEAVEALAAAAAVAGVRRFVHCSSAGVYGRIAHPPADEETPCRPTLAYERSKLAGEEAVRRAVRDRGLPAVILRPVWVYGPGCPRTERLLRAVRRRRFVVAGRGLALRHSVYVRDLVAACRRAAESEAALGQVLIVGDAAPVTVRQLVDEVARLTGAPPPPSVPFALLYAAALAAEAAWRALGREPPLSRRSLRFFTANAGFDIGRARRLLGWEPRYDLRTGLAETYRLLAQGRRWDAATPEGGSA